MVEGLLKELLWREKNTDQDLIFILILITFSSPEPLGLISNERVYPSFQHHVTWDKNNYVMVLETSKRACSH